MPVSVSGTAPGLMPKIVSSVDARRGVRGAAACLIGQKTEKKTFGQKGFEATRRCCENSANTIGACGEVARLVATTAGQARFRPGNLHIHAVDKNQNSGCQAGSSTGARCNDSDNKSSNSSSQGNR